MKKINKVRTPDGLGIICGVCYSGPDRIIVKLDNRAEVKSYRRSEVRG